MKAVILAAGKGTRMKSDLPKVLHEIEGKPLAEYVKEAAKAAGADKICFVIGYKKEEVKKRLDSPGVTFAVQDEQLGTGHAVRCAEEFIGIEGDVMILCGDTPLVRGETLKKAAEHHRENANAVTVLSTRVDNPFGYGRIIRDKDGAFLKSVEEKDATDEERKTNEVNSGMYIFKVKALKDALGRITNDNVQGEYYLPDTLQIILSDGGKVGAYVMADKEELLGVNDVNQLNEAAKILARRKKDV